MKAMRHLVWLCVLCPLCWAGLEVRMIREHSSITGYNKDKTYTFRGKIWDDDAESFVKVKDCGLDYPTGSHDLMYTGERHGVSSDEKVGYNSFKVRRQNGSDNGRSSGNRTFKLQPKGGNTWVKKTLSWTQYWVNSDPPPEG